MGNALRYLNLVLLLVAFGALSASVPVEASDSQEEIFVGRIAHVEGKLLRYIEEDKDWVLTVKDSPFGLEDALYAGVDTKAEFIMPNRTWLRVGENTQVQLIDLYSDATTVDVASGLARLYNKSQDAVIKVTTPFGYVVAPGDTVFDIYVGDESIEVIAVRGNVDFVHNGSMARYEVGEGSSSIIADASEVARGNGAVDSDWDDWNGERDDVWVQRLQRSESSAGFLPEPIRDEAYVLEENGQWERVYYEGADRNMWRPTRVDRGWRPFTAGRWTVYYGDNCWIPDESFGYVTHHYGSWVYVESYRAWYWLPPAARFAPDTPGFFSSSGWYPGRVGWIHSGPSIGWVPLAPNEVYYGYRPWGHRTVVVNRTTVSTIQPVRYRFLDEAVIIDRDHFYSGSRYTPHVQRNISRDVIINNYQPTTVINNTVINNFNTDKRRFAYTDVKVSRKPHATVIDRISDNQKSSRKSGRVNRERIERDLTQLKARSELPQRREVRRPMLATKLVDVDKMSQPINTLSLQKKEIKPKERERQISADKGQRGRPRDQGKLEQPRDTVNQNEQRRIRSPRDSRSEESEQVLRQPGQVRQPEEKQRSQEQKTRRPQQEESQRLQKQGRQRQQAEEVQERQEQQQQSAEKVKRKQQEERQKVQEPEQLNDNPSIKSPREQRNQEVEQRAGQQDQVRQSEEKQRSQEQKIRRQQQDESQRQQEQGLQRRQAKEVEDRQEQQQQSAEKVRRKQQQEERQQVQKPEQLNDKPSSRSPREKRNQEVDQRAGQQEQVRQQEQMKQRRQQEEDQHLQEQESQRQQQQERQQQQQQERQQQQEPQQQQQQEIQRRQEQEVQRQQQEGKQLRPKQEKQRQRQEEAPGPQEQPQSLKEKKRNQQEQEEWEQQQKEKEQKEKPFRKK